MQREGWWTYEYKHRDSVQQYHVVEGTANEIGDLYDLGHFDMEASKVRQSTQCSCDQGYRFAGCLLLGIALLHMLHGPGLRNGRCFTSPDTCYGLSNIKILLGVATFGLSH